MPRAEFEEEVAAGVAFIGRWNGGRLIGVMGSQDRGDVILIRHAYVDPECQRHGAGGALLEALMARARKPLLVGTWAAAVWAIRFYERHGFALVDPVTKDRLLRRYWTIPDRQIETSVVLAGPTWRDDGA